MRLARAPDTDDVAGLQQRRRDCGLIDSSSCRSPEELLEIFLRNRVLRALVLPVD